MLQSGYRVFVDLPDPVLELEVLRFQRFQRGQAALQSRDLRGEIKFLGNVFYFMLLMLVNGSPAHRTGKNFNYGILRGSNRLRDALPHGERTMKSQPLTRLLADFPAHLPARHRGPY